ncbi:uncharacterized protein LOC122502686 [Leptopilina heterotoma]|uniref:uncharacterized protein LOC122502686 n=1 Tax=Leptopilina heterotoma TaxID=63436 RepID=UPI001CA835AD|nr:uncharacterized protein LOC122502686 [Leptopilina heterotoma]XP_043468786.1 uncharacterized protein LOC122502686 [Leptopilina heterotoma]
MESEKNRLRKCEKDNNSPCVVKEENIVLIKTRTILLKFDKKSDRTKEEIDRAKKQFMKKFEELLVKNAILRKTTNFQPIIENATNKTLKRKVDSKDSSTSKCQKCSLESGSSNSTNFNDDTDIEFFDTKNIKLVLEKYRAMVNTPF